MISHATHHNGIIWFTGLSGAGKTTLSQALQHALQQRGWRVYVLDGDMMRQGLCSDLGFSREDRSENIRRASEVAHLFADAGFLVIAAFISPYADDRQRAREAGKRNVHNVYIQADIDTCEKRDVKGLYAKARAGDITDFTGISAPYEPPESPDLIVDTVNQDVNASLAQLLDYAEQEFSITAV